jgi:hypothetical protein
VLKDFKYIKEINELIAKGLQLPDLCEPANKYACRFFFREGHDNNHKPIYIQNPKRVISNVDQISTSGYALSCFEDIKNAIRKFELLKTTNKNIHKTIGNSICGGIIEFDDGLITKANNITHFDLYEYFDCNLSEKFTLEVEIV